MKTSTIFTLSLAVLIAFSLIPASAMAACSDATVGISFGGGWGIGLGGCKADPIGDLFREVLGWGTGMVGKALCSIALIILGVGALFGRVSWIQALITGIGIALVFGGTSILYQVAGGSAGVQVDMTATMQCDDPATLLGTSGLPLNHVCDVLRTIVNTIAGSTGAGIATLAIFILGLSALFGKISAPQALLVAVGIALVFGAVKIINLFWDNNNSNADCVLSALVSIGKPELVLCRFLQELRGDTAKFLSTLAVMILGFLALLGRLSWVLAVTCLVGIATVYGSESIMGIIAPAATSNCNTYNTPSIGVGLGAIEGVMCNLVQLISGSAGRALASAAVVVLGFGAMMGKVNYVTALTVAGGIAIAFGAPQTVFILTGVVDSCALSFTASAGVDVCDLLAR